MPPFFHISASNTRKFPNGMFEAMTSNPLSCRSCSPIVSYPALIVVALSWRSERISPVMASFSNAYALVPCMAVFIKPPIPALGSRKVRICIPLSLKVACICAATVSMMNCGV